jgi:protein-tyrosine phosphatase/membrane-associated phospholipid phosphatase
MSFTLSQEQRALWRQSLLWLLFLAPFFFLTYGQVNHYTASLAQVDSVVFDWERAIPFWPWTIVPYWSIDLLYGLSLFICTSRMELTAHVWRLIAASLAACLGFLLFPLRFSFVRPVSDGLFGWLFQQLEMFDLPYNQAPSLHIILMWLLWLRFYGHTPPRWRWLLHAWFLLIGVSVLTTWQHHFIDVVTGLAVGVVISYCLPVNFRWRWRPTASKRSTALAKRYYGGAAISLLLAVMIGGFGWFFLWPSLCLLMIGLGYSGLGADVFQKNSAGRMSPSARILLAPYQLGARLSFYYFSRRTSASDQIVPGMFLGSFPRTVPSVDAVLDMTTDWPRSRFTLGKSYIACPRLDLVAPSPSELELSVEALNKLAKRGSVLVHCALGLSRSAVVVVAWLVKQGYADNIEQALAMVRAARPSIIIHEEHLNVLSLWRQCSREDKSHA